MPENFQRFEFKFVEEAETLQRFISSISNHLEMDVNASAFGYRVDSIYFDCIANKDFHDKEEALFKRGKFRLRAYGNVFKENEVFLEYKGKHGDFVFKPRLKLSRQHVETILKQSLWEFAISDDWLFDYDISKEALTRPTLSPKSIVSYFRAPYTYLLDHDVRITLDSAIKTGPYKQNYDRNNLNIFRGGRSVLEIKFRNSLPVVIHHAIKEFNLQRQSNSKAALSFSENRL